VTYFPRFVVPWALVLLVLVPWAIYLGWQIRSLSSGRKWTAIVLRCIILICLVAALAKTEIVKKSDRLATFFLLDYSDSISEEIRLAAAQAIRETAEIYMTPKDESGLIVFGSESSIELPVAENMTMGEIHSYVEGDQTDLASAIRLALAAFPQGFMKRIVVFSDGNETRGSAIEEVKLAASTGAVVDVVPIPIGGQNEIRVKEVSTPGRVNADEPFQIKVVVHAERDAEGILRLYQRSGTNRGLLAEQKVSMQKGDNAFLLPRELAQSGFYEYEATIESPQDTILANNEGQAFTIIQGEPRILYVEADPEHSTYLEPALREEGLNVTRVGLGQIPVSLAEYQNYDVVILSDVSATDMGSEHLIALEAIVRDLGIGLIMVGGPHTFGAGGYHNTPVERALPVSMDIKQRKILPRGALVLILHTCEIPDGNNWARDIGIAALDVLSSQDLMGALLFDYQNGASWLYDVQEVGDKSKMRNLLKSATPGDMPDVDTTLNQAYIALSNASAAVKRVIIISDGDPAPPSPRLLNALKNASISVSTVCIAPHSPSDQSMLKQTAQATGGNYYFVQNPNRLPQIFTKEAAYVKRGMVKEEPFTPKLLNDSELLLGLAGAGLPDLNGYVVTSPKDSATIALVSHEDDPVLAHWRYGLGKSVAWTSDVTSRWAPKWVEWGDFRKFWVQSVRWSMREMKPSSFHVDTRIRDGRGHVRIDAVNEDGKFVNFLKLKGVVTGPAPDFKREEIELLQTAPGIYEGSFQTDARGVYMANMVYEGRDGVQGMIPAGVALGYSREYEHNTTNQAMLENLAAIGGGKVRTATDNPFIHDLPMSEAITPIWKFLVVIAACLLPLEIFIRRVVINFEAVYVPVLAFIRSMPGMKKLIPKPKRRRTLLTGSYGIAPVKQAVFAPQNGGQIFTATGPSMTPSPVITPPSQEFEEEEEETPAAKGAAHSEYTRQLLQAKQRALKKKDRPAESQDKNNEEE
jgi:uncharacterized membrane protein/Mg-chelatase subunit ChlD